MSNRCGCQDTNNNGSVSVAAVIDRHNRVRQDLLDLEKAIGTHKWVLRLGCTIIGLIAMDSRNLYNFGRSGRPKMPPHIFSLL